MKRSSHVALFVLGATAFTLAGCQEDKTEAAAFSDLGSCKQAAKSDGWFTEQDCETTFAEATKTYEETAPRYESKALCEEEHGVGACGSEQVASGGGFGGGIFMPLMTGYLLGQMLGGRPSAQPLVRTPGGGYATPSGTTRFGNLGSGKVGASTFDKAPVTKGLAPMTKATVAQRGGFGGSGLGRTVGG
jgi:uncharacterized protein YgiB involved in biofilm formation